MPKSISQSVIMLLCVIAFGGAVIAKLAAINIQLYTTPGMRDISTIQ